MFWHPRTACPELKISAQLLVVKIRCALETNKYNICTVKIIPPSPLPGCKIGTESQENYMSVEKVQDIRRPVLPRDSVRFFSLQRPTWRNAIISQLLSTRQQIRELWTSWSLNPFLDGKKCQTQQAEWTHSQQKPDSLNLPGHQRPLLFHWITP